MTKMTSGNLSGWGWAVFAFKPDYWPAGLALIVLGLLVLFVEDLRRPNLRYWRTRITFEVISVSWAIYRRIQMFSLCRRLYGWRRAITEFVYGAKP